MPQVGGKPGRQSKKKQEFRERIAAYCHLKKVDPFEYFVDLLARRGVKTEHKLQAATQLAAYMEHKLKSIEMHVTPEVPKTHSDVEVRQARITVLEKKRAAVMPLELLAGDPGNEAV